MIGKESGGTCLEDFKIQYYELSRAAVKNERTIREEKKNENTAKCICEDRIKKMVRLLQQL